MWAYAYAITLQVFQARMEMVEKLSAKAHEDLLKVNPKVWILSHFTNRAVCDDLTNNICESFNNYIRETRLSQVFLCVSGLD